MVAPTVSKQQVREALEAFAEQGVSSPGLIRLQKHIGHGSIPRIKRFVEEIKHEKIAPLLPGAKPPPDSISAAVNAIWQDFEVAMAEREKELEDDFAERHRQFEEERASMQAVRDQAVAKAEKLEEDLVLERGRGDQLDEDAKSAQQLAEKLNVELKGERELVATLKESRQDMNAAMTNAAKEASKREKELKERIEKLQQDNLTLEQRRSKEVEDADARLQDLRDIVAHQQREIERIQSEGRKSLEEKDRELGSLREAFNAKTSALEKTEGELRELERVYFGVSKQLELTQQKLNDCAARVSKLDKSNGK